MRNGILRSIARIAMSPDKSESSGSASADTQRFVHLSCQQTVKLSTQIGRQLRQGSYKGRGRERKREYEIEVNRAGCVVSFLLWHEAHVLMHMLSLPPACQKLLIQIENT